MLEPPNVATPNGTPGGAQFAAVLKSGEPGVASHVASCAAAGPASPIATASSALVPGRLARVRVQRQEFRFSPTPRTLHDCPGRRVAPAAFRLWGRTTV